MEDAVLKKTGAALKRIEGQVRGVQKMVENDRYCIDIVTQIAAAADDHDRRARRP